MEKEFSNPILDLIVLDYIMRVDIGATARIDDGTTQEIIRIVTHTRNEERLEGAQVLSDLVPSVNSIR